MPYCVDITPTLGVLRCACLIHMNFHPIWGARLSPATRPLHQQNRAPPSNAKLARYCNLFSLLLLRMGCPIAHGCRRRNPKQLQALHHLHRSTPKTTHFQYLLATSFFVFLRQALALRNWPCGTHPPHTPFTHFVPTLPLSAGFREKQKTA